MPTGRVMTNYCRYRRRVGLLPVWCGLDDAEGLVTVMMHVEPIPVNIRLNVTITHLDGDTLALSSQRDLEEWGHRMGLLSGGSTLLVTNIWTDTITAWVRPTWELSSCPLWG